MHNGGVSAEAKVAPTGRREDWARYWRDPERPLEAMHAHFVRHVFPKHSHDSYSFAVTEEGAQRFVCRGAAHTSAAGMVMAFNPDEPHDGHAAVEFGFRYRIVHIGPDVVRDVLADATGGGEALPLFARPVVHDPLLTTALLRLHTALVGGAGPLTRDDRLTAAVTAMVRRTATGPDRSRELRPGAAARAARRARALLQQGGPGQPGAAALAAAVGCSRYGLYRAFMAEYGMAPSDFERQLRLRAARDLMRGGCSPAEAAARTGFTDQSHLHRWFVRCFGITPGTYQRALHPMTGTAGAGGD